MLELSEHDKAYIRATEELRHEIRAKLEDTHDRRWQITEKLLIPLALIVITAGISGLLVPHILKVDDDQRHLLEIKSKLITDIVADAAGAQMASIRYQEQLCDYWDAALGIELRKRLLRLRYESMAPEERQAEYESLVDDRKRENERRIAIDGEYAEARARLVTAGDRLNHMVMLHYGNVDELKTYRTALVADFKNADDLINSTQQDELSAIFAKAKKALQNCATEDECRTVVVNARTEIDEIREAEPKFESWAAATHPFVAYLATHDPDVKNRTAKASAVGTATKTPAQ
jgi:hypothetical protein